MSTFDKREDTFEKKFVHDQDLRFKAEARRDKLLAAWAAAKLGRSGQAAEDYVNEVLVADLQRSGPGGVFQKIRSDFDRSGVDLPDHQIQSKMDEFLQKALAEVRISG